MMTDQIDRNVLAATEQKVSTENVAPEMSTPPKVTEEATVLERARTTVVIEYMFIVVAALMFMLIYYLKGRSWHEIIALPEWSVCSVIMSGIVITKFVAILGRRKVTVPERMSLMAAIVLITAFIPSIIVLSMMILLEPASTLIINAQMFLFAVASAFFLSIGIAFSEAELEEPKE
ncbi:MAG: hypothetical protein ABIY70_08925 [Capsulimonas sp.]|uniref:hypothetical protein n=1 Tax=Capsulimonas sp. TaxID=2494211 RepID=UPI00326414C8